jgi:hypothetical protein
MGAGFKKKGCLEPRMGRPRCGVLGSFPEDVRKQIDHLRPTKEGWGAATIRVEMSLMADFDTISLPSERSICYSLKERGRCRTYYNPEVLASEACIVATAPHDVWQMDAEGNKLVNSVGMVSFLNIKDVFSKTYIGSIPCVLPGNFNHLTKKHYQWALRLAFREWGLCNKLQVDHESIFYENSTKTPFPTSFHLWALGIGIPLCFTPGGKPFKQGAVEKSHQTMHTQVCAGRTYPDEEALFISSQQRRQRLNYHIPCRTLDKKAPLKVFPETKQPIRLYDPQKEESLFDIARIYDYLDGGKWYRKIGRNKIFTLGAKQYSIKDATPNTDIIITFDRQDKYFHCIDANGSTIADLQPKGLSFKELSGNLDEFILWERQNSTLMNNL